MDENFGKLTTLYSSLYTAIKNDDKEMTLAFANVMQDICNRIYPDAEAEEYPKSDMGPVFEVYAIQGVMGNIAKSLAFAEYGKMDEQYVGMLSSILDNIKEWATTKSSVRIDSKISESEEPETAMNLRSPS